ncbi:hypothetical protein [Amycolatopsis nalaikhensis]|uniref:Uncharacterized protein n=1 Tax=Amycolatopsis nalaikhensis TaxID=715472 RepID=A0ABY8XJP9_9PSEU|nr:hypothetical protein [Amycolatopsis sp. 2-2]WIV55851.1 hypothetical protein QP939_44790 [Amycolatopsis sp. 2-2]
MPEPEIAYEVFQRGRGCATEAARAVLQTEPVGEVVQLTPLVAVIAFGK